MLEITNRNHLGDPVNVGSVSFLIATDFRAIVPEIAKISESDMNDKDFSRRDYSAKVNKVCTHKEDTRPITPPSPVTNEESPKAKRSKSKSPGPRYSLPEKIKISVFADPVFSRIRKHFDITPKYLTDQLSLDWSEVSSPGKGGSTFFFMGDLVLKSMNDREVSFLKTILPKYQKYIMNHKCSLLPVFLGWYGVSYRTSHGVHMERLLLMRNILQSPETIPTIYDLKGSTVNRDGGSTTVVSGKSVTLYKDNDFKKGRTISLDLSEHKQFQSISAFHKQIANDAAFLQSCNIVDYSLLLGIRSPSDSVTHCTDTGIPSVDASEVCFSFVLLKEFR